MDRMDRAEEKRQSRLRNFRAVGMHGTVASVPVKKGNAREPLAFLRPYRMIFLALAIFILGSTIANRRTLTGSGYRIPEHAGESVYSIISAEGLCEELTVGELAWYVLRLEREVDQKARVYNAEDPTAYWKLRISNKEEASYISEIAKKTVLDYALRDELYAMEAVKAGFEADEEAMRDVRYEAEREYFRMSEKEAQNSALDPESLTTAMEKEELSAQYMRYLNDQGIEGVDVGGAYYESLLAAYGIEYHPESMEGFRMGYLTIN